MSTRMTIAANDLNLSLVDFGGAGRPLLALHGHYSCARTFVAEVARFLEASGGAAA